MRSGEVRDVAMSCEVTFVFCGLDRSRRQCIAFGDVERVRGFDFLRSISSCVMLELRSCCDDIDNYPLFSCQ